ncbi:PTS sugar transporter subunit IIA [Enterococcus sp. LJL99]
MSEDNLPFIEFIKEPLLLVQKDYQSKRELFEAVFQIAFDQNWVREDFLQRVQAREDEFPTGIQLENLGVAIPHTDPECVLKEFVAVITLNSPILFQQMDDPAKTTPVEIIFVLGLNQPHTQLKMLQTLMGLMQDTEKIASILEIKTTNELFLSIKEFSK